MDADRGAASQATAGRAGRRATLLRHGLGLAAVGAVAYFFVRERDLFAGFGAVIARLNWYWVVLAFAAELTSVPPSWRSGRSASVRWRGWRWSAR